MKLFLAFVTFIASLPFGAMAAASLFIDRQPTWAVLAEHAAFFMFNGAACLGLVTATAWLIAAQLDS